MAGCSLGPPLPVTPLSVLESARLVPARYRGHRSLPDSLNAQRSFYAAQRAQVLGQLAELHNGATLYQVLGGS
jgi:outer membrane protein TolC